MAGISLVILTLLCAAGPASAARDWPLPPERPSEPPFVPSPPPVEAAPAPKPLPAPSPPAAAKSEAAAPPVTANESAACLARLRAAGAQAEAAEAPPTPLPDCSVVAPVTLSAIVLPSGEELDLPAHPLLACAFAETFVSFARDLAAPLGAATLGARLTALDTGPGYECRPRNHVAGAKTSAHGQGIAIDLMGVTTAGNRRVAVERQDDPKEALYIRTLRTAACGWFTTVLGPGSDAAHATHLHLDGLTHGSGGAYRICE